MRAGVIAVLDSKTAAKLVVAQHYLHRRPPISYAFGLYVHGKLLGVVTYGVPASRHLQKSACPSAPDKVLELNRLWLDDSLPANSESWFVSRTLKMLPPRIVVSYADPLFGHFGYIYRALNFRYAGWTDMERKTPRYDYIPLDPTKHTREAFRSGVAYRRRRVAKVKYWIVTGDKAERRALTRLCGWPSLNWKILPPPVPETAAEEVTA
ncbi:MAG: Mom family adenine methylcarbamoylation protein [Blastococcus sp.]